MRLLCVLVACAWGILLPARLDACNDCEGNDGSIQRERVGKGFSYWCDICQRWVDCPPVRTGYHRQGESNPEGPSGNKPKKVDGLTELLSDPMKQPPGMQVFVDTVWVRDTVVITQIVTIPCPDPYVICPRGFIESRHGDTIECIPDPSIPPSPCHKHVCIGPNVSVWVDTCAHKIDSGPKNPIRWDRGRDIQIVGIIYRLREITANGRKQWYLGRYRNKRVNPFTPPEIFNQLLYKVAEGDGTFKPTECIPCK